MDNCQVFTPSNIVNLMLDTMGYYAENIKNKTIFEPSFGDGAFLEAIVRRILDYADVHCMNNDEIIKMLNNVYGVEIDEKCYSVTIDRLNALIADKSFAYNWEHIVCDNTLRYSAPIQFDFIVGNPPYRRVMHLDMSTRDEIEQHYQFGTGNTDLFVVFFERCLQMLNSNGKLCFITPNSYFKNSSQASFREYLVDKNLVETIIDYGNVRVFDAASTYTAIVLLNLQNDNKFAKYTLMSSLDEKEYDTLVDLSQYSGSPWVFIDSKEQSFLDDVYSRKISFGDICSVQYGIATNADKVYIIEPDFTSGFEDGILKPVIKASTLCHDNFILFPYLWDESIGKYVVMPETMLQSTYPKAYAYLQNRRTVLEARDMDASNGEWYRFGRGQGIQNSNNRKFVLKHILSPDIDVCEFKEVDEHTFVYSGIYIIPNNKENYDIVRSVLLSADFKRYLFLVGKHMSGGYRNINAKAIKAYRFNIPKLSV